MQTKTDTTGHYGKNRCIFNFQALDSRLAQKSVYDQEIPQSQLQTNPWDREKATQLGGTKKTNQTKQPANSSPSR